MATFQSLMEKFEEDMTGRKICEQMDVLHEANLQSSAKATLDKFKGIMEQYKEQTVLRDRSEFKRLMEAVDDMGKRMDDIKTLIETFNSIRG